MCTVCYRVLKNLRHIVLLNCKKEGREVEKVKGIIYFN
jgi:hypothetical protein